VYIWCKEGIGGYLPFYHITMRWHVATYVWCHVLT
jgi:hypothetical protein